MKSIFNDNDNFIVNSEWNRIFKVWFTIKQLGIDATAEFVVMDGHKTWQECKLLLDDKSTNPKFIFSNKVTDYIDIERLYYKKQPKLMKLSKFKIARTVLILSVLYYLLICFISWTFNLTTISITWRTFAVLMWIVTNIVILALMHENKCDCIYTETRDIEKENNTIEFNNIHLEEQLKLLKQADELLKQTSPALDKIKKQLVN